MSENNRSLSSGRKSFIKNINNLNQSGPDEENKNQQSDELPFISELSEIEKDKKITYHYICPKCQTFPYIDIIDKNTIKKRCQCFEKEKEKDEEKETKKDQKIDKEKVEEKESSKIMKIKDLINEIKNENNKNDKKIMGLLCDKHKLEFRYYCSSCRKNICKDCCELHFKTKECMCDFFVFDFNNYDYYKKAVKLNDYFINQNKNQNTSESVENSYISQDESNSDELNNNGTVNEIIINDNGNVNKEENNPYYFYELFRIIYKDYKKYPNNSHFNNIDNIFKFMQKEMDEQNNNKNNNENQKEMDEQNNNKNNNENNNNNNKLKNKEIKGKNVMTMIYKNDNKPIKLFGGKYAYSNLTDCQLEIDDKLCNFWDEYKSDSKKEEIVVKLYFSDKQKEINLSYMFANCVNLKSVYGISRWKQTQIINLDL